MSFENDWDTSYMEHVPPRACRYLEVIQDQLIGACSCLMSIHTHHEL